MNLSDDLLCAIDPVHYASTKLTIDGDPVIPDPWQADMLRNEDRMLMLCCSRQSGKSTTTAIKALHHADYNPNSLTLIVSGKSLQQAQETFKKILAFAKQRGIHMVENNKTSAEFANGSRIISLPASADNIRGYSSVDLLILDEAAFMDDDIYNAVRPMVAVSNGQTISLSTPNGKRGFFYDLWINENFTCKKISVTANECDRITDAVLAEFRETMAEWRIKQEFFCQFVETEDSYFSYEHIIAAFVDDLEPLDLDNDDYAHKAEYDNYGLGVDLGKLQDWSASITTGYNKGDNPTLDILHIYHPPLKTRYSEVIDTVKGYAEKIGSPTIIIDATGAGVPLVENFEDAMPGEHIVAVTITSGGKSKEVNDGDTSMEQWHVAKKILVSALQIALQNGRVRISKKMKYAPLLQRELENFKAKLTSSGNETFEAEREAGSNDDLVLALALAVWYGSMPEAQGMWF